MKLSILSRFFQPRAGPNDRRDSPISSRLKAFLLGEDVGLGLASTAGVRVDEETAMRVTAVYACVKPTLYIPYFTICPIRR
nr:hypothetical protein [Zhaonella formicivorans]